MKDLVKALQETSAFAEVRRRMTEGRGAQAEGLWGSSMALLVAALGLAEERVILCVLPHMEQAEAFAEDLSTFAPGLCSYFPASDELSDDETPDVDALSERLLVLRQLFEKRGGMKHRVLVAPVQAALQGVVAPEAIDEDTLEVRVGRTQPLEEVVGWLVAKGFRGGPEVEAPGEFSRRGGILDVFPYAAEGPVRIEFFGDEVESIRTFELDTQVSVARLEGCRIAAVSGGRRARQRGAVSSVFRYLPEGSWLALREPAELMARAEELNVEWGEGAGEAGLKELTEATRRFPTLEMATIPATFGEGATDFGVRSVERFGRSLENVVAELRGLVDERRRVVVFCNNEAERQRMGELLAGTDIPRSRRFEMRTGTVNHGFDWAGLGAALLPHHELFHRYQQRRTAPRHRHTRAIDSFVELEPGDYVVHATHGIGRFRGMEMLSTEDGRKRECLRLQYADGAFLFVPASKIELVQKYVGPSEGRPPLNRLGSKAWSRKKERARQACEDHAAELLRLQALREAVAGTAHPPDGPWQREFEQAFIYTETEDQLKVAGEIKRDLESLRPMDRLVCGDVGYGKTELAMRATFKVVVGGAQVAVLVPTTVLAMQHHRTFSERMADYPVVVEMLSRFRTRGEQADVVKRLAEGAADVVIGTHRLLQGDVSFRNLGLVIVDEEQRFGVMHKERLKHLRETVDVLTLTATPIPRTLHMALLGMRDMSTLETPPADRLAIQTRLWRHDPQRIRQAVLREMGRDGQVYFVHNRVETIGAVARQLRELVPEARIVVGHGQMSERELEAVMRQFVSHEADVLVCTTIIESGLDIPNVNTILINNADMFGLADLHQLRGRVGRYKHRAYAYLLLPRHRPVTPLAEKRMKALEEFAELGAGFRIAMRDLEIRGAGNILGAEQSGHIAAVGYEMYCRLLEVAVRRMKNEEPPEPQRDVTLTLGTEAYLPAGYVAEPRARIELYRRLNRARSDEDVDALRAELEDRFGRLPPAAETLLEETRLRAHCERARIRSVVRNGRDVMIEVDDMAAAQGALAGAGRRLGVLDGETIHLRLESAAVPAELVVKYLVRVLAGVKS